MGDTFPLKITDKVCMFNALITLATTAMDAGSAGFTGAVHRSIQLIYSGLSN
jgi:hypothetical protein